MGGVATLSLRDIADLAGVRRSVVSMWRNRPVVRGQHHPFPEPVAMVNGVEQFGRDEIVEWLGRTGRGRNAEQRLDAPTLSVPAGVSLEDLVTLLCLQTLSGQELTDTTAVEREHLAAEHDPGDAFLLREVRTVDAPRDVLGFIDDLVEASFGPAEALASLERGRAGRATGARDLTDEAVELLRAVVRTCGSHIDPEGVPLMFTGGSSSLALSLADDLGRLIVRGDGIKGRALLRRAKIRDLDVSTNAPAPRVHLWSVLGQVVDEALDALDELVLDLAKDDVGVAVGPAGVLCDRLNGGQERRRAHTLRSRTLAVAVRLPRGLWREAHRQALGLWICVGGRSTSRPFVSDLAAFADDEASTTDLAADVAAALADDSRRSFRYLRPHDLHRVLSGSAVVPRGARPPRWGTSSTTQQLDRIQAATVVTATPVPPFDLLVISAPGTVLLRQRSLAELKEAGSVQMHRGKRIDPQHSSPHGTVPVLSADGATAGVALDPFDADRLYPGARRTEPGDVVFLEKPRPRALVDPRGGALVGSPSRILRLGTGAGIGPNTLAAIINQLPDGPFEWQTWNIPTFDAAAADQLEATLMAAARYRSELDRRLDAIQKLVTTLIDGVTAGTVAVIPPMVTPEGR
ncbi:hypothetical protein [Dactylosporangium matsuzakiense]|uniref:Uncharacterized protein n=1 Tax=Dactylosporangium matsuzakiense TaxID=53360 RepID=A0A9W6KSC2_9ACTN|nr:hypothetical protein [Dactylosporangium matsuzakiense]UWZ43883.1 hypothetical protein Dmats_41780 [Dactylosporangium matsuzakiense]GLL06322.1 hypothetical protein GCM10017581_080710 [Dactylosporangium matsuzakiense]